jgi:hypothetical protein
MSAIDTTTARLVERAATAYRLTHPPSTRPAAYCPVHPECVLEGGPIRYRCEYGHSVPAADIDREVGAPGNRDSLNGGAATRAAIVTERGESR